MKRFVLMLVIAIVPAFVVGPALADNVYVSDNDNGIFADGTIGTLTVSLTVGDTATLTYFVKQDLEGGPVKCNPSDGTPANISLHRSDGSGNLGGDPLNTTGDPASLSATSFSISACSTGDPVAGQSVTITGDSAGTLTFTDVTCDDASNNPSPPSGFGSTCFSASNSGAGLSGGVDRYIHHPIVVVTVEERPVVQGTTSGLKYYDSNVNGQHDPGEPGIEGWPINVTGAASSTLTTDSNGEFAATLAAGDYSFAEAQAGSPWVQTGNTTDQATSSGGNSHTLNADKTYGVTVAEAGDTSGLNFGNVCTHGTGGNTIGFWRNKNGLALLGAADFEALTALNLRNADGSDRNFTSTLAKNKKAFASWLQSANAVNMSYMLSAQLAALTLNVRHGFTDPDAVIAGDGRTVAEIIADADALLGADGFTPDGDPNRADQEAIMLLIDAINNGGSLAVVPDPANCPAPVFPS